MPRLLLDRLIELCYNPHCELLSFSWEANSSLNVTYRDDGGNFFDRTFFISGGHVLFVENNV